MKIAVIGSGLSGIKTASLLHKIGHDVTVFEKSRGFGGRMAHRRLEWAGLDLGAQYFTARDPAFIKEVHQWCRDGDVAQWRFSPHRIEDGQLVASSDETQRFIGLPTMNQPVKKLGADLSVKWRTQIVSVERGRKWTLCGAEGERFTGFDWLVVSAPAEQTHALLKPHSLITAAIPEVVHEPCWALGLGTRGNVANSIQGIFGDETVRWVSRLSSRPGFIQSNRVDDVWMLHFAPGWSEQQSKDSILDVGLEGISWLSNVLQIELHSVEQHLHFWRYANIRPFSQEKPYLLDQQNQLAVVGAWCAGGRVEGAWLSAKAFVDEFSA
ncbi:FAD-dependent oxidoreductase [uncultured Endozoicomonas sp.]|uniref:NAD(P)/FAD-dependent oxidoreductase n=1 Tax=uncultured Endozoicomonas sp. TaxID=432652 RepID=UPI00262ACA9D|nr:FAD-dependent oxidoreductase [uncultured Endozoicomonas sp.]